MKPIKKRVTLIIVALIKIRLYRQQAKASATKSKADTTNAYAPQITYQPSRLKASASKSKTDTTNTYAPQITHQRQQAKVSTSKLITLIKYFIKECFFK